MVNNPSKFSKGYIAFGHDVIMAGLSLPLALYLRLGDVLAFYPVESILGWSLLFAAIGGAVFWRSRLYRGVWRYASLMDLTAIAKASTLTILIFLPVMFFLTRLEDIPRSFLVINWFLLMAMLGGPRFLYRMAKDRKFELTRRQSGERRIPILLVGAGDEADLFLQSLNRSGSSYEVVGIVSDTPGRVGRVIRGHEVIGSSDDIRSVVARLEQQGDKPQRLVLTKEDVVGERVRELFTVADELGMSLARAPEPGVLREGVSDRVEVREIAVEDLLGRPQTVLDRAAMADLLRGRKVLVTGAGGTIGSELARQICQFCPASIALVDNGEFNLYQIDHELGTSFADIPRTAILADVRNRQRITTLIADEAPEVVFHAAALKHVPMVEHNPLEGLLTNVIGTRNVADACVAAKVAKMVMISTDKAVNPTNIMGASKRIAECYVQSLDRAGTGTAFVTVRFGNVLGSTGSVVPLFERQLKAGGPLTVTHPEVTRYFMTVREAVELVLQTACLDAGERGRIFVLDMGQPVKIADLARQMIRLAGLRPDEDVKISYTGLRPGEKLYEELLHGGEPLVETEVSGILLAEPRIVAADTITDATRRIEQAGESGDISVVAEVVSELVPEYRKPD
jgi:O-antigen biosynthesis protein WbqV